MCGITGFINPPNKKASLAILKRMNHTILHRGPDDHGELILGNMALANRRLAIIDLSAAGHMPMTNHQKSAWITYNGEIYNFRQLKQELINQGYRFQSNSDTEVILNLYHAHGPLCVQKLNGMFALAIWDVPKRQLFLARDHFGIKPLHYYFKNGLFIFGSEIKAILAHPQVKKSLNLKSLSQYFSIGFGAIPSPNTIFKDIYKLPPANCAILNHGKLTINKYWHLEKVNPAPYSFPEAKEKLLSLLSQSVKDQLVSDVPLGGFLSGGIDSSTIVALMKNHHRGKIKTFSIGFTDPKFDESSYARTVARIFKTEHYTKTFKVQELLDILPKVIQKLDEPLADASILPTYLLSQFTRQHVTVALSGDGGDELFGGYPTYLAHKIARLFNWLPKSLVKILLCPLSSFASLNPIMKHSPNLPTSFKFKRFLDGLNKNLGIQYLNFMGPTTLNNKSKLFSEPVKRMLLTSDPATEFINHLLLKVSYFDKQKQLQYLDLMTYLAEDCLVKTDRASSFNSLEIRVPFLNPKIAELAFSLPGSYHVKGLTLKRLFKAVVKEILPQEIINRPKKGFGIPVHRWLRQELKPLLTSLLSQKRLHQQNLFNPEFIQQLINEHQTGKEDHRMVLWNLLIFQLWYDRWFS